MRSKFAGVKGEADLLLTPTPGRIWSKTMSQHQFWAAWPFDTFPLASSGVLQRQQILKPISWSSWSVSVQPKDTSAGWTCASSVTFSSSLQTGTFWQRCSTEVKLLVCASRAEYTVFQCWVSLLLFLFKHVSDEGALWKICFFLSCYHLYRSFMVTVPPVTSYILYVRWSTFLLSSKL